jgi:hypothetical protein
MAAQKILKNEYDFSYLDNYMWIRPLVLGNVVEPTEPVRQSTTTSGVVNYEEWEFMGTPAPPPYNIPWGGLEYYNGNQGETYDPRVSGTLENWKKMVPIVKKMTVTSRYGLKNPERTIKMGDDGKTIVEWRVSDGRLFRNVQPARIVFDETQRLESVLWFTNRDQMPLATHKESYVDVWRAFTNFYSPVKPTRRQLANAKIEISKLRSELFRAKSATKTSSAAAITRALVQTRGDVEAAARLLLL